MMAKSEPRRFQFQALPKRAAGGCGPDNSTRQRIADPKASGVGSYGRRADESSPPTSFTFQIEESAGKTAAKRKSAHHCPEPSHRCPCWSSDRGVYSPNRAPGCTHVSAGRSWLASHSGTYHWFPGHRVSFVALLSARAWQRHSTNQVRTLCQRGPHFTSYGIGEILLLFSVTSERHRTGTRRPVSANRGGAGIGDCSKVGSQPGASESTGPCGLLGCTGRGV